MAAPRGTRMVRGAIQGRGRAGRPPGLALALAVPTLILAVALAGTDGAPPAQAGAGGATATPTTPPAAVFSATVHVVPAITRAGLGETLSVRVWIEVSEGCRFPIYDLTLLQDRPLFAYTSPPGATVGPPVSNPFTYTLTAVATGTTTLDAVAFGERYCDDYWQWRYLYGTSRPVAVREDWWRVYVPQIGPSGWAVAAPRSPADGE